MAQGSGVRVEYTPFQRRSSLAARWRYAISAPGPVDLIAVLPFWFTLSCRRTGAFCSCCGWSAFQDRPLFAGDAIAARCAVRRASRAVRLLSSSCAGITRAGRRHQCIWSKAACSPDKLSAPFLTRCGGRSSRSALSVMATSPSGGDGKVRCRGHDLPRPHHDRAAGRHHRQRLQRRSHRRDFIVTWSMVAKVPLFSGLDAGGSRHIMLLLRAQQFEPGGCIVRRGEPGHSMYFIAAGEVEITPAGAICAARRGPFLSSEVAVLQRTRRSSPPSRLWMRRALRSTSRATSGALMERDPRRRTAHDTARGRLQRELVTPKGDLVTEDR